MHRPFPWLWIPLLLPLLLLLSFLLPPVELVLVLVLGEALVAVHQSLL